MKVDIKNCNNIDCGTIEIRENCLNIKYAIKRSMVSCGMLATAYEVGEDWIKVQFGYGGIYLYTAESAGSANVEEMKSLALSGQGLSGFISQNVKYDYAEKYKL